MSPTNPFGIKAGGEGGCTPAQAAIIGVGGGRDLLSAYLFGFRDITGVELNPIFIELLTGRFRTYSHVAELPGIRL